MVRGIDVSFEGWEYYLWKWGREIKGVGEGAVVVVEEEEEGEINCITLIRKEGTAKIIIEAVTTIEGGTAIKEVTTIEEVTTTKGATITRGVTIIGEDATTTLTTEVAVETTPEETDIITIATTRGGTMVKTGSATTKETKEAIKTDLDARVARKTATTPPPVRQRRYQSKAAASAATPSTTPTNVPTPTIPTNDKNRWRSRLASCAPGAKTPVTGSTPLTIVNTPVNSKETSCKAYATPTIYFNGVGTAVARTTASMRAKGRRRRSTSSCGPRGSMR